MSLQNAATMVTKTRARAGTILIIEDDPDISELVEYNLAKEGFQIVTARDGEEGLRMAATRKPDLVLLDLMLPAMDGIEVCRRLRQDSATRSVGLIMLTAKGEESDIVLGLEMGADDYVVKPFSPRELLARIRAVLRSRSRQNGGEIGTRIELGDLVLDALRHEALVHGESVSLTRAEFRLLWTLASRPGRVYTRDQLVDSITAGESIILDRNVDVHVSAVRRKLGPLGNVIVTVRGVGYRCRD